MPGSSPAAVTGQHWLQLKERRKHYAVGVHSAGDTMMSDSNFWTIQNGFADIREALCKQNASLHNVEKCYFERGLISNSEEMPSGLPRAILKDWRED